MPRLGQHFLKDRTVLEKIAAALQIRNTDTVIEIGPGHGELTRFLLGAKKVIAVEKDSELAKWLKENLRDNKNVEIIHGDILKILPRLSSGLKKYKLTGNIPYYITGFLFRTISGLKNKPELIVLAVQKEVAERMVALPPKMNLLAASVQFWALLAVVTIVRRTSFRPKPKVDSVIIRLAPKARILNSQSYYQFIKILFKQPRKTILNNLSAGLKQSRGKIERELMHFGVEPSLRPQNLELGQIIKLSAAFKQKE